LEVLKNSSVRDGIEKKPMGREVLRHIQEFLYPYASFHYSKHAMLIPSFAAIAVPTKKVGHKADRRRRNATFKYVRFKL
jgi:hypothetical protein